MKRNQFVSDTLTRAELEAPFVISDPDPASIADMKPSRINGAIEGGRWLDVDPVSGEIIREDEIDMEGVRPELICRM